MLRQAARHTRQRDSRGSVWSRLIRQTLNSYARLIWVWTPSRNSQQLSIAENVAEKATSRSYFERDRPWPSKVYGHPFSESIV
ncbi:hypothetical protein UCMB321_0240 [Pseudomonas batumici]|uniref:Uncharacterized protein n=1 Tax=Pseudomonas batumici TaxID=226910 RepID=A0A0C2F4A0_9PSED|nr:hypothetical protein UCMB321_0240 [Pseudomonas batumici]